MFRDWIFFPLVALAAGLLILASLGPYPFRPAPAAQAGVRQEGALVFTAEALARAQPGRAETALIYSGWTPLALRVATAPGGAAAPESLDGIARLDIAPEAAAALAGKAMIVEILTRPIPLSTAPDLLVAIDTGDGAHWVKTPIGGEPALVSLNFPAAAQPPKAIALYPANPAKDRALGVEIGEIRVRPR